MMPSELAAIRVKSASEEATAVLTSVSYTHLTFALWRLGEEDGSLWNVWDKPTAPESLQALGSVQPGHDVDNEGDGDIIRVTGLPQSGKRTIEVDSDELDPRKKLIIDEHMDVYCLLYTSRCV